MAHKVSGAVGCLHLIAFLVANPNICITQGGPLLPCCRHHGFDRCPGPWAGRRTCPWPGQGGACGEAPQH